MKKTIYIFLILVIISSGCVNNENSSINRNLTQPAIQNNETKTSFSPNGKYRAEAYGTITSITYGGLYPYEGIRVVDVENNKEIWKMEPGYYFVDFTWSSDSNYVAIYYEARIYGNSIVVDIKDKKEVKLPYINDVAPHYGAAFKPQENRPDPYFKVSGWEDTETVIVDFEWTMENPKSEEKFKGQYSYNLKTKTVTYKNQ